MDVRRPSTGPGNEAVTITVGPRAFDRRRDAAVLVGIAAGLGMTVVVAVAAGLPGVIGTVYVLTAAAAWAQGFRRSWRVGPDRIEARRWFRWRTVERTEVRTIRAAFDEMGIRAVEVTSASGPLEIDADDVRVEPLLAEALARFVQDCDDDGVAVDPAVATVMRS